MNSDDYKEEILSVPVWGMTFGSIDLKSIEYFLYSLKNNTEGKKRSNFLGWQSQDNLFTYKELSSIIEPVTNLANDIAAQFTDRFNNRIAIDSMWANINPYGAYNAHHIHSGTLSGVFWVKIPEKSGRLILVNPAARSEAHRIRVKNYGLTPQAGACIIFPSWLEHYVEPNENNEDRISISFNID